MTETHLVVDSHVLPNHSMCGRGYADIRGVLEIQGQLQ